MMYQIVFSEKADKAIAKFKKSNPIAYKKIAKLLIEIAEHPRVGTGHPEPLVDGNYVTYSRRFSAHNRIIYDIYDDIVIVHILSAEGHYDDK